MKRWVAAVITAICVLGITVSPGRASGVATNFSEVYLDNMKIGGSYNLAEIADMPMWIRYTGAQEAGFKIESIAPGAQDIREGYQAIPDPGWVTFSKTAFQLKPGESENVSVTVRIPDTPELKGKKFMAHVFITAQPDAGQSGGVQLALGLKGKLFITIAGDEMTPEERAEQKAGSRRAVRGLAVLPDRLYAEHKGSGVVSVTEQGTLKLVNTTKQGLTATVEAVDPEKYGFSLPSGYSRGDPRELTLSKKKIKIEPDATASIEISARVPGGVPAQRYYLIRILASSERMDVAKYVPIYLN